MLATSSSATLARSRWAISSMFFLHGLCFSSWASRIPAVQLKLGMSDALLGSQLLALPLGSILSSLVSPRVIDKVGMRRALVSALSLYSIMFIGIGLTTAPWQLGPCLFVVGCLSNVVNVSINTQAVTLARRMQKAVMGSFHGLWSLAGFVGAGLGTLMMSLQIVPAVQFSLVFCLIVIGLVWNIGSLLDIPGGTEPRRPIFMKPPPELLGLGMIAFFSMICEGAMFDWSGVYFQNVLQVPAALVGLGYGSFMGAMASSRFVADRLTETFGIRRMLSTSGLLIAAGLLLAISVPSMATGIVGFMLVGAGTSSVVPLVLSQAGLSSSLPPSAAIAATSTVGFVGFLIGPPLIGWIAGASSLRVSFLLIAGMGLGIVVVARRHFAAPLPADQILEV